MIEIRNLEYDEKLQTITMRYLDMAVSANEQSTTFNIVGACEKGQEFKELLVQLFTLLKRRGFRYTLGVEGNLASVLYAAFVYYTDGLNIPLVNFLFGLESSELKYVLGNYEARLIDLCVEILAHELGLSNRYAVRLVSNNGKVIQYLKTCVVDNDREVITKLSKTTKVENCKQFTPIGATMVSLYLEEQGYNTEVKELHNGK